MKITVPWAHLSRSYKLLFSNAVITVPITAAFFVNQAAQFLFHPSLPGATLFGRICASFISIFAFTLAYTSMVGMTQTAWGHGKAALQDGIRAVAESLDHIVLVTIMVLTSCTLYSISSTFVKQSLTDHPSVSGIMISFSMVPLAFAIFLVLSYFLLYTGPSIIIGRKNPLTSFIESVKIVSQNRGTCFSIAILFYGVFSIGFSFLISNNFFYSQIFQLFFFLLLFSPSVCFINFLICGEYLNVRRFSASPADKSWKKYAVVPLSIIYIAVFSSLTVLPVHEIFAKVPSSSASFRPKTEIISINKALQLFITETRSIKANHSIEKMAIEDAYSMIVPRSDANRYLDTWFPKHNPFTLAHGKIKFIYGLVVQPDAQANAYDITWKEAVANPSTNAIKSLEQWEARIEVVPETAHTKYFITQFYWRKR